MMTLCPNMTMLTNPELSSHIGIMGQYTWYITSDSPDSIADCLDNNGWNLDDRMIGEKTINLGIIKLSRSIMIIQDEQQTMVQVLTILDTPFD